MAFRGLLFTRRGKPRLARPALIVLALFLVLGIVVRVYGERFQTPEEQAIALAAAQRYAAAEAAYLALVKKTPTVPLVIALIEVHDMGVGSKALDDLQQRKNKLAGDRSGEVMPEPAFAAIFDDPGLPPEVARIGRYVYSLHRGNGGAEAIHAEIVATADATPPAPWSNHVLAHEEALELHFDEAAARYEREARYFPERKDDMDQALSFWIHAEAWDYVGQKLADPVVAGLASASTKYQYAVHVRDWRAAARWLFSTWLHGRAEGPLGLAAVPAFVWAVFLARLGKAGERPRFRIPMYAAAWVLGVLSVGPTFALIGIEEATLKLVETGDAVRDFLFFTFGVGLREEASKLLLFLPLLPILRRNENKLDVVVCGAFVGLGFASEENVGYFVHGNLTEAMGRFLTANFLHIALTSTLATALDEFLDDTEANAAAFSSTALFVIGLHGAYDFLASHQEVQGGYLGMALFFFIARRFLDTADRARGRADRGASLLQVFVLGLAIVTGASFVYACMKVGIGEAGLVLTEGVLGEAIIAYVFVRTLREM
jgi:RsiW-degrading membrane proteinase PrsW (M82 family)